MKNKINREKLFRMVSVGVVDEPVNQAYDIISTGALLLNLAASIMLTFDRLQADYGPLLLTVEAVTVLFFGVDYVLRLITSDTDKTKEVLSKDCVVNTTTVIAAKLEDRVGALCDVIHILANAGINIEYVYAFTASEDFGAYVVIRVDDVEKAQAALVAENVPTLNEEDIKDI